MADELPSYTQCVGEEGINGGEERSKNTTPQSYSIRDEVSISRLQHVAVLVSRVLPSIQERAKQGISRSTLLLFPSDQADCCVKGQLVGFADEDRPILVHLEGRFDSTQFWTQAEALNLLREQMLRAIAGDITPSETEAPLVEMPARPARKTSFFGRKQANKTTNASLAATPSKPPVSVEVGLEYASFRSETEYGLFETLQARAVQVTVDVR